MASTSNDVNWKSWGLIFLLLIIIIGALLWYAHDLMVKGDLPQSWTRAEIILSVILILGVIALVITLAFTSAIFNSLGLSDPTQSLGLPEGSVRAVIALSLILIFMISAVFLYAEVQTPYRYVTTRNTQEMINDMPQDKIAEISQDGNFYNSTSGQYEPLFKVTRIAEKSTASTDIAKQIITTVSTLVVAIAGFYFGTKAVSTAKDAVAISDPVIRSINPNSNSGKVAEDIPFTISGKNFESPKVKLIHDSKVIEGEDITSSPTTIKGTLKIDKEPDKHPDGEWTVVVTNSDKEKDKLENAFTVSRPKSDDTEQVKKEDQK